MEEESEGNFFLRDAILRGFWQLWESSKQHGANITMEEMYRLPKMMFSILQSFKHEISLQIGIGLFTPPPLPTEIVQQTMRPRKNRKFETRFPK